ncbi:MAG TPA: hypothetical protein VL979_01245 [Solirubrobacteraceae bacterium]|nr:hypothetical protein [Solirubrobacteraceae bacterium]
MEQELHSRLPAAAHLSDARGALPASKRPVAILASWPFARAREVAILGTWR